ncbi:PilZ domain-containing protein [Desulfonema ishimotonii]|uniref:PilZ domain-containing protein n=1 Tax=Desulfonema ishimotonii TaxID=45657 RepID=A0A401FVK0_9BACT|nr:PilZ domain-containing protein [Desulfonema ishimotonii]GBC60989.1 PilZ domain-containing protein [Desulfonema ishimotonii]
MDERRNAKRLRLIEYLRVFEQKTDLFVGHLVDVSDSGLALVSPKPIKRGQVLHLRVEILADQVMLDARCMWCRKDVHLESYDSGFRFLAISPETRMKIRCLTDALRLSDVSGTTASDPAQ